MLRSRVFLAVAFLALIAGAFAQDANAQAAAELTKNGVASFVLAAVLAGLFALTTPCVFPMIPVTVSFFAKQAEKNPQQKLSGPLAYCFGIVSTFTVVGILCSIAFGVGGLNKFAAHPATNIVLGILFVVLSLSLFGLYEISMPSWLMNKANEGRKKGGLVAPFAMGLTFALTSFTCTLAFVATLLGLAANGSYGYPILGMLVFSATFALPFFFLALFPSYLAKLPKSGSWMVTLKGFMGFLELAAAAKFFQQADLTLRLGLFTRELFIAVWTILFLLGGLYLFGLVRFPGQEDGKKGPGRIIVGGASVLVAVYFLVCINGRSAGFFEGFMPPSPYPYEQKAGTVAQKHTPVGELEWITDDPAKAQALAKKENKLIFIDFTGYTCVNCRRMEKDIFPREAVKEEMSKYVLLRLYTDDIIKNPERSEKFQQLQNKLVGSISLPYYVIVDPELNPMFAHKDYEPDESKFIAFLKQDTSYKVASK